MKKFKFIDLFSGIGGFHQAMTLNNGQCVLAADIDNNCNVVYQKNYGINSRNDVTKLQMKDIPNHDVLCAGFPCQSFSKAGKQKGIHDTRGTMFFEIERILRAKTPKYIMLENVRNLVSHDNGKTWKIIKNVLVNIGYRLVSEPIILSPHQFGTPQFRERIFIIGKYDPLNRKVPIKIDLKNLLTKNHNSVYKVLDENVTNEKYLINEYERMTLNLWNEFYQIINPKILGFPIWLEYLSNKITNNYFPEWKNAIIAKNNQLYLENKKAIDNWKKTYKKEIKNLAPSHQKFEWQAGTSINSIWDGIIQFRPSGIRVKRPDVFPALVAIVQIPIIGKYQRRLTESECARLQNFKEDFIFDENMQQAYKQFGNSVNVKIVNFLFNQLIDKKNTITRKKPGPELPLADPKLTLN